MDRLDFALPSVPMFHFNSTSISVLAAMTTPARADNIHAHSAARQHHHRATRPLEQFYVDFFIPAQENVLLERAEVVIYILDEATRCFLWTHVTTSRTATITWFCSHIAHLERKCRHRVVSRLPRRAHGICFSTAPFLHVFGQNHSLMPSGFTNGSPHVGLYSLFVLPFHGPF
jgi:hypothetical protein